MDLVKIAILLTRPKNKFDKLGPFDHSKDLDDLAKTKDMEQLESVMATNCMAGFDNDGVTGFEIFSSGFELAQSGEQVWVIDRSDDEEIMMFFTGTFDEVWNKISKLPDAP